jgi:hypothetical protein
MERLAELESLQVTLQGEIEGDLRRQVERELDGLVRDAFAVSTDPKELTTLLHELHQIVADARHPQVSSDAENFLQDLVRAPIDPSRRLFLVAQGVLQDFARRNAVIEQTISTGEVGDLLNLTRQAVNDRWKARKLLGFRVNDTLRFPVWQFHARWENGVLPALHQVLTALDAAGLESLDQIYWLTSPKPEFEGSAPVELLGEGRTEPVLSHARGAGAH